MGKNIKFKNKWKRGVLYLAAGIFSLVGLAARVEAGWAEWGSSTAIKTYSTTDVGVGVVPEARFHVRGANKGFVGKFTSPGTGSPSVYLGGYGNENVGVIQAGNDVGWQIPLSLNPISGNVGIGIVIPKNKLHVSGGGLSVAGNNADGRVIFANNDDGRGQGENGNVTFSLWGDLNKLSGPSIKTISTGAYGMHRLSVFQHNASDYATENEVVSILPNGNVGIGENNPNVKLVLSDYVNIDNNVYNQAIGVGSIFGKMGIYLGSNNKFAEGINGLAYFGLQRSPIGYKDDFALIGSFDSATNRYLHIGYNDNDDPRQKFNAKVSINTYNGNIKSEGKLFVRSDVNPAYGDFFYGIGMGNIYTKTGIYLGSNNQYTGINPWGNKETAGIAYFGLQRSPNGYKDDFALVGSSDSGTPRYLHIGYNDNDNPSNPFNAKVSINTYNGNVGIGITNPQVALAVKGEIKAGGLTVDSAYVRDFVFEEDYKLMPLSQLEESIKAHKHLPGVASASEVAKKGLDMVEMQMDLLQKVEELTLYTIELKKENAMLQKRMESLEAKN